MESLWMFLECACRILGVSTATVLCGVGIETIQQGQFTSLGIYLIVSSVGIMLFEMAFFLDTLLVTCLICPPDWQIFVLWGKMARVGGFHKFLYYSIMSVVCFLHPVLVWHATIPGTMLLVTAFFNFILSKKPKASIDQQESDSNQNLTTVCITEQTDKSFSFLKLVWRGRKEDGLALTKSEEEEEGEDLVSCERRDNIQAMLAPKHKDRGRQKRRDRGLVCFWSSKEDPVEREMEEMDKSCDTTSDTAPMISD
ncbi:transmembrane protein 72 [Boleophthalmus pectinirostris]|uniref:transmembrane protein 72 n=1 Tax=Boleophthalmus pectinirostris TaxID=150288 RepID=UPI002431C809|nr:transmembrane protein 72 [Boleophthalmus pectinirostris]